MSPESDPSGNQNRGLHQCPQCDSSLVQPVRWEQAQSRGRWRLWLRCPECEWAKDEVYGEREIDAYDEVLDAGTVQLSNTLSMLTQENMGAETERFVKLLQNDVIVPEDF